MRTFVLITIVCENILRSPIGSKKTIPWRKESELMTTNYEFDELAPKEKEKRRRTKEFCSPSTVSSSPNFLQLSLSSSNHTHTRRRLQSTPINM